MQLAACRSSFLSRCSAVALGETKSIQLMRVVEIVLNVSSNFLGKAHAILQEFAFVYVCQVSWQCLQTSRQTLRRVSQVPCFPHVTEHNGAGVHLSELWNASTNKRVEVVLLHEC